MKVIDLLNKIANGEEVPKKIKHHWEYEYKFDELRNEYCYMDNENRRFDEEWLVMSMIKDEVEILDEEDEFIDIRELGIPEIDTVENERICRAEHKINDLIKNQKKIIEEIKELN